MDNYSIQIEKDVEDDLISNSNSPVRFRPGSNIVDQSTKNTKVRQESMGVMSRHLE